MFEIAFTCAKCKNMFVALCSVKQDKDHFVSGLLCDRCAYQTTLGDVLDFDI